jgi:hypothetical protein
VGSFVLSTPSNGGEGQMTVAHPERERERERERASEREIIRNDTHSCSTFSDLHHTSVG